MDDVADTDRSVIFEVEVDLAAAAREADGVLRKLEEVQEVLLALVHGGELTSRRY